MQASDLKKLSISDFKDAIKLLIALLLYPFVINKYRGAWLMCERKDSAQDNGWIFFEWIKKFHTEQKVFFALNGEYIASHGLMNDSSIVKWGSIKHFIIYLSSRILIKAVFMTPRPCGRVCYYFEHIFKIKKDIIYLRHGISKDGVEQHLYNVQHIRLFICGAKPEYEYIEANAGYPKGWVKYTGFARFDDLLVKQRDDKFILIIPTWRRYIEKYTNSAEENEELFKKSAFYSHYASLLNSPSLSKIADECGYKIKFCIHAQFKKYLHLFNDVDKRVELVEGNESIHDLLISTSLLITDYSSVFFDAAYMHKPIIYYHFDYDEFRAKHFSEGYFSYLDDGMGPVAVTEKQLIDEILTFYDGEQFVNREPYISRCQSFFPVRDSNNCERIYNAIKEVEQENG